MEGRKGPGPRRTEKPNEEPAQERHLKAHARARVTAERRSCGAVQGGRWGRQPRPVDKPATDDAAPARGARRPKVKAS